MSPLQVLFATIVFVLLVPVPIIILMVYCCCRQDVCGLRPRPPKSYKKLDELEKKDTMFPAEPLPPEPNPEQQQEVEAEE